MHACIMCVRVEQKAVPGPAASRELIIMSGSVLERLKPAEYHEQFLAHGLRPDGRGLHEVREAKIWQGVFEGDSAHVVGSALLTAGHTRLVASVTAEISPSVEGGSALAIPRILFNVDIPRACAFEVGRDVGTAEGTTHSASAAAGQLNATLAHIFSSPAVFDASEQLSIKAGAASWTLYVNVVCLEHDGNLTDWTVAAAAAALDDVKLPALDWDDKARWWRIASSTTQDGEEATNSSTTLHKHPATSLKLKEKPCSATIALLAEKYWIADPSAMEERLGKTVTVWMTGQSARMQLLRPSGAPLDVQESLQTLFQVTLQAMCHMYQSIKAAPNDTADMWELCN